jgi:bifunctional UDP-N-acetylglucosamine pyrophosphorylase/glucosamine-1-phosphate N-acetyltransferase
MKDSEVAVVVLAAGRGSRMKSALPKVLHAVAGRPLLGHVLDVAGALKAARIAVVVGPDMDDVAAAAVPHAVAVQAAQRGTADAVLAARGALAGFARGTVLILYGDTPFVGAGTLAAMLARRASGAEIVVLGFRPDDPEGYGRLIVEDGQTLARIVEYDGASPAERAVDLCNSGVMAVAAERLFGWLEQVGDDNAKGEFYLTDIVALARRDGADCAVVEAAADELQGVNSRADLARAETHWQRQRRARMMAQGVTLQDPDTVYFSHDTRIECDVTIGPNVVFGPGVSIARGSEIRAFSHLEGVRVGADVTVGPFARLRPGAVLEDHVRVGNFVEIKNAVLGPGAKAGHLSYIGDCDVGAQANIGAGTITCNYDGYAKHRTAIGKGAFIGSNSALVAPVSVGDGAIVGAGSVITKDVAPDALAVGRGRQREQAGWAAAFRAAHADTKQQPKRGKE